MAQERHEFSGKSVDEAVAEGLKTLRLRPDQVTVEVLNKGSRGIFGLGSEPAQVRLTVIQTTSPQPAAPAAIAPEPPTIVPAQEEDTLVEEETSASVRLPAVVERKSAAVAVAAAAEPDALDTLDAELETIACEMLTKLVNLMGFPGNVHATWKEGGDEIDEHEGPYLLLDVRGGELGALIGRRGETLDNLQYLLRLMINQRFHRWTNIIVDVDGYKERRAAQLQQIALRTATQVAQSGRAISLEPMPANERRIIHMVLRDHPEVYTESSGDGDRRKVHIIAKD